MGRAISGKETVLISPELPEMYLKLSSQVRILLPALVVVAASASTSVSVSEVNNKHFVVSNNVLIPGLITEAQLYAQPLHDNGNTSYVVQAVSYLDNAGKTTQTIARQQLPGRYDLIQPMAYDEMGRSKTSYLPMGTSQTSGFLLDNPLGSSSYSGSAHQNFYTAGTNGIPHDQNPFSSVAFESSPLSRIIQQGTVGTDYQPGQTGDSDISYGTNASGITDVRRWTISAGPPELPTSGSPWQAGTLSIVTITDGQGVQSRKVTSPEGMTVLSATHTGTEWAETYYVYDTKNNLRFIIPPQLMKILNTGGTFRNPTEAEINTWVYQKVYDSYGRVIESKGPGTGWNYVVYDKRGRIVLTQDAKQNSVNEWRYTKYDEFNRPVISGIYRPGAAISRTSMQLAIDGLSGGKGYQNINAPPAGSGGNIRWQHSCSCVCRNQRVHRR
jgi:hypothetical protein